MVWGLEHWLVAGRKRKGGDSGVMTERLHGLRLFHGCYAVVAVPVSVPVSVSVSVSVLVLVFSFGAQVPHIFAELAGSRLSRRAARSGSGTIVGMAALFRLLG